MCYITLHAAGKQKAEVKLPWRKWGILLLLAGILPVGAAPVQLTIEQHIKTELKHYLAGLGASHYRENISLNLPATLQDSQCDKLIISRRDNQPPLGRVSYSLGCESPQRWQSRAIAQVSISLELVVASRTLERDEILTAELLTMQQQDINAARYGLELQPEALYGMSVRRRIRAGEPVTRNLLQAERLVSRGGQVRLQFAGSGFTISAVGIAQADGQLGDTIKVINSSSGAELEGTVTGRNIVQIGHN